MIRDVWVCEADGPDFDVWVGPLELPEGAEVKPIDVYYFFHMGAVLGPIGEIEAGDHRGRYRFRALVGHKFLRNLLTVGPDGQPTPSVLSSAWGEARHLQRMVDDVLLNEGESPITEGEAAVVKDAYRRFTTAFRQVLLREPSFHPDPVGIYDTRLLVEHAERVFPDDVQAKLGDKARTDWVLAGRCLAFGLGTACGFHTVRATESVIHEYYVTVTGGAEMKRKDRNWGSYVRNLNHHRKQNPNSSKADQKLIALIDQIREHHRNVVIHPEDALDQTQAMVLFNICQSAIISFVTEIAALRATSAGVAP